MGDIAFIDLEIDGRGKILDAGAIRGGKTIHTSRIAEFVRFIGDAEYLCGHNIIEHDCKYLKPFLGKEYKLIDTLYISPLMFPKKPYHRLLKDDKIISDELNNPLNDAIKARDLFEDEVNVFRHTDKRIQQLYYDLTSDDNHFRHFLEATSYTPERRPFFFRRSPADGIREALSGMICDNADVSGIIKENKVAAAYAMALILTDDRNSIMAPWVLKNYPDAERIMRQLRECDCGRCPYCTSKRNPEAALKRWYGYEHFRKFGGEPLQENAVNAALEGQSILAIFPTGGGKSLTFQIPALMAGESVRGLTVVISPLQSLMKDQVENLEKKGISDAVYINGLLSPVERKNALDRIISGEASLLYIAPESLRSKTIEKVLLGRTVVRIVIDEAHCFSAWGQDFRIEYMHIADFVKQLRSKKGLNTPIPVSCFTATAKPKVISDIADYFRDRLNLELKRYTTDAARTNLHYTVLYRTNDEKYPTLRNLLYDTTCPAIVYVTRTKTAEDIASRLSRDGLEAKAFHGQMETRIKVQAQDDFMNNRVRIVVATSAFGMGVDKSDVGLVVHYEISDSLENYIQEAGRAGRDVRSEADCYVLYNDDDLNRHFILLNQTKLTLSEINQVWRAVKNLTSKRDKINISALEIARKAGWDEIRDVETKVKSAIAALENAGFLRRGMNSPRIFATSIVPRTMDEASEKIEKCADFTEEDKVNARRIIKSLLSERSRAKAGTAEAESRVDYLSDMLGIEIRKVIGIIERMRVNGILARDNDMTAYLRTSQVRRLGFYAKLEQCLLDSVAETDGKISIKELNEKALAEGISSSTVKDIRTVLFFWTIRDYMEKTSLSEGHIVVRLKLDLDKFHASALRRNAVARYILNKFKAQAHDDGQDIKVNFSLTELVEGYNSESLFQTEVADVDVVEEALLFLAKTGIVNIEGGFMVLYNKIELERLNKDNRSRYKKDDYRSLDDFYRQRIQQIHIVGKYANMMVSDEKKALAYVHDYFTLDFKAFIKKYFDASEAEEISRNVSKRKYDEIFGSLTGVQSAIINDKDSRFIVVPAGPGSGKTYVLVRKLASLILMEDVKSEQLLMLTFSRAAATEFKTRLEFLIGGAARFVEIKTFHSYCFDLLGKMGTVEDSEHVVRDAVTAMCEGKVERSRVTKSILVIDEAQDMSADEFALVEMLIRLNDDMRVIAVGDDDQNIYEFRGSDSCYMKSLISNYGATVYNMTDNFRSSADVISVANAFVQEIRGRLKAVPIKGVRQTRGKVNAHLHRSTNYEQAIVNEIVSDSLGGSTCVLTLTNDDALIISALLNRSGRKARLIQSKLDFNLQDLAELHYFHSLVRKPEAISIDLNDWEQAKNEMSEKYSDSQCLDVALNCIAGFESEGHHLIYLSDFENYLRESSLETFIPGDSSEIIVSTIHKAKGREYDNVYMSLKGLRCISDKERRAVYVGMTRAKNNLSVHYDNPSLFDVDAISSMNYSVDETDYGQPSEILLQLSHKDVVLSAFLKKWVPYQKLHSGSPLVVRDDGLYADFGKGPVRVVKYSTAFSDKVNALISCGYTLLSGEVRFQVYWHHEDREVTPPAWREDLILLPDLLLSIGRHYGDSGCLNSGAD